MTEDQIHLKQIGARILAMANDLKRTPHSLAGELSLSVGLVASVIEGAATLKEARTVAVRMTEAYPVSWGDVWIDRDSTDRGVTVMRADRSKASSRIFDRPDPWGGQGPYYEYRDTAMCRGGPIRPEWIAPLRAVDDASADNSEVVFNKGHLLHQMTFFVGPVNFYWETAGTRHCAKMETGDSNFITPFVPHSFAVRPGNEEAYIVAVTFGAQVRRNLDEFGWLTPADADALAGDARDPGISAVRLRRFMAEECLSERDVAEGLAERGLAPGRVHALLRGAAPTYGEAEHIAQVLFVHPRDLLIGPVADEGAVGLARRAEPRLHPSKEDPRYEIRPLARLASQPHVKGAEIGVASPQGAPLRHHLHQYAYNFGEAPVRLQWGAGRECVLGKGDSACFLPMVEHRFSRVEGEPPGRLLVVKVPGGLTEAALEEYSTFDPARRSRTVRETSRWF